MGWARADAGLWGGGEGEKGRGGRRRRGGEEGRTAVPHLALKGFAAAASEEAINRTKDAANASTRWAEVKTRRASIMVCEANRVGGFGGLVTEGERAERWWSRMAS